VLGSSGVTRFLRCCCAASATSALIASGASAAAGTSQAAAGTAVRVWYRSSEGCPDGAKFIELLRGLGRAASLAQVGDPVDFVVTVAYGEQESSGRLERQSSERTVAIRDVAAARCEEVAEALALSLDLAVQPGAEQALARAEGWRRQLGVQGGIETGLGNALLGAGALFLDVGPTELSWSLRFALRGAYGARDAIVSLDIGLLAARAEACWAWPTGELTLGPCAGVDLGLVFAEATVADGRTDIGVWSSAAAHARGTWQLSPLVALEAQAGVLVPFVRYRFQAQDGDEVTESAVLGFQSALGVAFRF
jgi:hypothetical protein